MRTPELDTVEVVLICGCIAGALAELERADPSNLMQNFRAQLEALLKKLEACIL